MDAVRARLAGSVFHGGGLPSSQTDSTSVITKLMGVVYAILDLIGVGSSSVGEAFVATPSDAQRQRNQVNERVYRTASAAYAPRAGSSGIEFGRIV